MEEKAPLMVGEQERIHGIMDVKHHFQIGLAALRASGGRDDSNQPSGIVANIESEPADHRHDHLAFELQRLQLRRGKPRGGLNN